MILLINHRRNKMYLEDFSNLNDVLQAFSCSYDHVDEHLKEYNDINVLLAIYTYEDYDGSAFVLFERDDVLYEVNGGHCSCYGLEDQWEPEETSVEALRKRMNDGNLGSGYGGNFADDLRKILNKWEA